MYPQEEIDGFERYWRRRKPGRSTPIHCRSDVNIFFRWAQQSPASITVHHIDQFIDWQRGLGRAPATIQRRLVSIRMFYDCLAYIREEVITTLLMTAPMASGFTVTVKTMVPVVPAVTVGVYQASVAGGPAS